MKKLGLILLFLSPLGCAPADTPEGSPNAPADTNATSAAVHQLDDAGTVPVAIVVPAMH
mgnify:CR=1 FL=1